jgi:hypothetical protein
MPEDARGILGELNPAMIDRLRDYLRLVLKRL